MITYQRQRIFKIQYLNTSFSTSKSRVTFDPLGFGFNGKRLAYSTIATSPIPTPDNVLASLISDQEPAHQKRRINHLTKSTTEHQVLNKIKPSRSKRVFPVRKQFIFESYLDLFTSNEVCLLFKTDSLSSKEWNSIRGKIKNLKATTMTTKSPISFGEFRFTEEDEEARLKQHVPKIQFLRTKMLLPVLKTLLKDSKINNKTFNSLVYTKEPPPVVIDQYGKKQYFNKASLNQLTGSLFSITQPKFEPEKINKVVKILNAYSKKPIEEENNNKKLKQKNKNKNPKLNYKIKFLIGVIDKSCICKDENELNRLSNLPSLDVLRLQMINLIHTIPTQNLLSHLNSSRGSNLLDTLNSHIQTQQSLLSSSTDSQSQSTDNQSPST